MKSVPRQQSLIAPEIQNPFVHNLRLGYLDILKVSVRPVIVYVTEMYFGYDFGYSFRYTHS